MNKIEELDLNQARTYQEWLAIANKIDLIEDRISWRKQDDSDIFHSQLLREHINTMREYRANKEGLKLIDVVQESLSRHSWELNTAQLYTEAYSGTKFIISEYFQEIEDSINFICDNSFAGITDNDKLKIFEEGNRIHGNTALMLSGGASFGIYHLGVVKALHEQNLLPKIIAGSSMGAIIAAAACSKTDEELTAFFAHPKSIHRVAIKVREPGEIVNAGSVMDPSQLMEHIESNIGDFTFKEAFQKTGRTLNISVSATRKRQRPRVLNHFSTPSLLIEHSALASCAIPGIFPPVTLLQKNKDGEIVPYMESEKWIDGSVHLDIPMQRIIRLHNVSRSIVSQANPHVIPFVKEEKKQGIFPFFQDLISSTIQAPLLKFMDLGVDLSEKMPWLSVLDKARSMIDQEYRGDINIYYPMTLGSVSKIVSNPTQEEFEDYIRKGELATWPKIAFIRDQMHLNKVLEACIHKLKLKMK
jgi:TAG lipase / steryl ester hydrolase / phospholipase A2 / LPA acyltransferase